MVKKGHAAPDGGGARHTLRGGAAATAPHMSPGNAVVAAAAVTGGRQRRQIGLRRATTRNAPGMIVSVGMRRVSARPPPPAA